jgi:glutathione S-transferase
MILIGQYDSPFVRRVGIALTLYALAFTHRPWSSFGDAALIKPFNPLCRVPTLVLDTGEPLTDSHLILAHLDSLVPAERALMPREPVARRRAQMLIGLATGTAEAAVSLFYELRLHQHPSEALVARRRGQIADALDVLEAEAGRAGDGFLCEARIGHADIAVAAMLRFLAEAHPGLAPREKIPALASLGDRLEARREFQAIAQPFIPPA